MLLALHPDKGDQLQQHLHLPSSKGAAQGGPRDSMRELRLSWLLKWRLMEVFLRALEGLEDVGLRVLGVSECDQNNDIQCIYDFC